MITKWPTCLEHWPIREQQYWFLRICSENRTGLHNVDIFHENQDRINYLLLIALWQVALRVMPKESVIKPHIVHPQRSLVCQLILWQSTTQGFYTGEAWAVDENIVHRTNSPTDQLSSVGATSREQLDTICSLTALNFLFLKFLDQYSIFLWKLKENVFLWHHSEESKSSSFTTVNLRM